jgi:hypothetical protein
MAVAAKAGIHGLRFPDINPKRLEVTFVAAEELPGLREDTAPRTAAPKPSASYVSPLNGPPPALLVEFFMARDCRIQSKDAVAAGAFGII